MNALEQLLAAVSARVTNDAAGTPNRRIFRGGPYGGDQPYMKDRMEKNGPFPERGPDEGLLMGARNGRPINGGGDWIVRVYVKPFVDWIWGGCLIMALGGVLAATDRRYRSRKRAEEASAGLVGATA